MRSKSVLSSDAQKMGSDHVERLVNKINHRIIDRINESNKTKFGPIRNLINENCMSFDDNGRALEVKKKKKKAKRPKKVTAAGKYKQILKVQT